MMMNKTLLRLFGIALLTLSCSAHTVENINVSVIPQAEILPFDYVIDAGTTAQKYIKNSIYQTEYIRQYSSTLKEILLYRMKYSDFKDDEIECSNTKDENHMALSCSRFSAAKAFFEQKIPLNIKSFGYTEKTLVGKIEKTKDSHSVLVIKTAKGERWQCVLMKEQKFSRGTIYKAKGYLSPEGDYGTRGEILKREFVVTQLEPTESNPKKNP